MVASAFLRMNKALQRVFAHPGGAVWHRAGGPSEGHQLTVWFTTVSEEVDADGFRMTTGLPSATIFVADILAIDPTRAGNDNEIFKNNGTDTLTIDGETYRVESCKSDGYGKSMIVLRKT